MISQKITKQITSRNIQQCNDREISESIIISSIYVVIENQTTIRNSTVINMSTIKYIGNIFKNLFI